MAGRRGLLVTLGAVGAGAGYYLYRSGGDPKVAQKQFESDAAEVSSKVKQELPGSGKEAKKEAEATGQEAGAKLENAYKQAKDQGKQIEGQLKERGKEAEEKLEKARQETGNQLSKAVDKFDQTVQDGTEKAKTGISSWFGGSK